MSRVINNTSGALFKRMLGKNYIEKVELTKDGFTAFMTDGEKIPLYFKDIRGVRTGYYLDENMPCRIVTILMNSNKKYGMGVSSGREEVDLLLRHYARYQLGGDIPEDIDDINVVLQYGVSGYSIRLEKGYLIETENGHATLYLLNAIDYYEIDKISDAIDIKFSHIKPVKGDEYLVGASNFRKTCQGWREKISLLFEIIKLVVLSL